MKRLGLWGKCLHGCCGQRQMLFDAACAWFILLQKVKSSKRLKLFEVLQMWHPLFDCCWSYGKIWIPQVPDMSNDWLWTQRMGCFSSRVRGSILLRNCNAFAGLDIVWQTLRLFLVCSSAMRYYRWKVYGITVVNNIFLCSNCLAWKLNWCVLGRLLIDQSHGDLKNLSITLDLPPDLKDAQSGFGRSRRHVDIWSDAYLMETSSRRRRRRAVGQPTAATTALPTTKAKTVEPIVTSSASPITFIPIKSDGVHLSFIVCMTESLFARSFHRLSVCIMSCWCQNIPEGQGQPAEHDGLWDMRNVI